MSAPTFLDLFCGCGGFSLGLTRAGFRCLAAIDFNEEAVTTFKANFPKEILALRKDLTTFTPAKLAAKLGVNSVDVIVGGPPCQGFSTVRQVDAANHGSRVRKDKRRYLFRASLDYVAAFRPRIFVMENVLGIQSAAKGKFFTLVQAEARALRLPGAGAGRGGLEARRPAEAPPPAHHRRALRRPGLLSPRTRSGGAGRRSALTKTLGRHRRPSPARGGRGRGRARLRICPLRPAGNLSSQSKTAPQRSRYSAGESNGCGRRVGSSLTPGGIQTASPSRARGRRTR